MDQVTPDVPFVTGTFDARLDTSWVIVADDGLGWALRRAGRPAEALARTRVAAHLLGTADALLSYHLAAAEPPASSTGPAPTWPRPSR